MSGLRSALDKMGKFSDEMLLPYHGIPGYKEKTTSREAAYAVAPKAEALREQIYQAIKNAGPFGATADEAAQAIGSFPLQARPRVTELRAMDRIKPSLNRRRPSSTGRSSIVWVVSDMEK